jgi:DNA-binding SARP family transcriptional activator/streptogramin lyase
MGEPACFRLLGTVQAWRDGHELELGGPLQRALLACLLLNVGRVVSREQLIDELWGQDPPPRAARSLETKVSRLRKALGDGPALVARAGGYLLEAPADEVDVHTFDQALARGRSLLAKDPEAAGSQLRAALAVWRGPALGGIPTGVLDIERAQLEDARLEALEARIDADLALGKASSLVGELHALRLEHPSRERFTEQLMLALYRSGRQTDALEAYRAAYWGMRDELGLEPGPKLRELERAILRQDDSLGPLPIRARLAGPPRRLRMWAAAVLAGILLLAGGAIAIGGGGYRRPPRLAPGLILVDAHSGAVQADVPVGGSQGVTRSYQGHLWTLGDDGVMAEVDPASGALVRSVPVGVQWGGVAVGAGGIWVTDRNGPTLLRIDALTGEINLRARLSSRGLRREEPNMGIAVDAGSLWVARGPEAVDRLNPSSLKLERRIQLRRRGCGWGLGGAQCSVVAGGGHVWVAGGLGGWLARIDEATNRLKIIKGLHPYLWCLAVGGGSVWVGEAHDIARLAPDGRVLHRYPFSSDGIGDMSFDDGALWASADSTGELLRIDASTGQVHRTKLGNLLISASASRGLVAVSAVALPTTSTRGLGPRVLRVALREDWLNIADPAVTRPPAGTGRWQWQLDHAICAELYMHPDGPDSTTLVPELAKEAAHASPNGRTWTIPIRSGFRFSPPLNRAVTPEDVRATLLRALSPQLGPAAPAAQILRDVVGLRAYRDGASNTVSGIRLHGGMLQITTRRPVRDLPALLALPYFCVLPAGTPTPPGGFQDPLPTAGPYYLAEHQGGDSAVVRPNPNYVGPRPRALSGITFQLNAAPDRAAARLRRGQLDYLEGARPPVSPRVGCRASLPGVPGLDLAAVCLRSAGG